MDVGQVQSQWCSRCPQTLENDLYSLSFFFFFHISNLSGSFTLFVWVVVLFLRGLISALIFPFFMIPFCYALLDSFFFGHF